MNEWGIKARVILLALIPTGLVALIMGSYFVTTRIQDLNNNIQVRGQAISNYLAQTSEYAVLSGNNNTLTRLVHSARDGDKDILAVAIYNQQSVLLSSSGEHELVKKMTDASESLGLEHRILELDDSLIVRAPIYSQPKQNPRINSNSNETIKQTSTRKNERSIGHVAIYFSQHTISLRQYQTIVTASVILFLGLVLGAVLAQNMSRNITTPIIQLANALKRIKEGQVKVKINSTPSGELKTLVNGFNDMSDALYEAREEMQVAIEQATADINSTNTALEEQNVELNIARKEALESSRVKSEFFANMSHEIRTPMNGVIGFTNLLLKTNLTEIQRRHLITINNSSNGLLKIIDDILDFSKIEAGKMKMEEHQLDLTTCVDDTMALLAPAAQNKNLELIGIVYEDVPTNLKGDAGRIMQVLGNLCNNAIKFTEKGTIQIRVILEDESDSRVKVKFNITDTGIGLTKEQQKVLFQAFTQADTTTTRKFGGTGLGLVISKSMIEEMNGRIGLDSEENVGSTFWFTLDLAKDTETKTLSNTKFLGKKIVFHDSNKLSQLAANYLLKQIGTNVDSADNIEELIEHVKKQSNLDKDTHLAIIGGYKNNSKELQKVKNSLNALNIPLLVLINSNEESVIQSYLNTGYRNYLSKPLTLRSVTQALTKIFNPEQVELGSKESSGELLLSNKNIRILCVDDNEANLDLLEAFIKDFNVKADFVDSGILSVEKSKLNDYDLVFMDIQMPTMDGLEATAKIRSLNQHNAKVPIIALTAHAIKGEREKIISGGMDDFLTKPITQEELRINIEKWTGVKVSYVANDNLAAQNSIEKRSNEDTKTNHKSKEKRPNDPLLTNTESAGKESTNLQLESIDWEMALKNANNKKDLAIKMLSMLVNSFEDSTRLASLYLENLDKDKLISEIHKVHGATAYCGTPNLKSISHLYETELKENGISARTQILHAQFIEETKTIVKLSVNYLN